MGPGLAAGRWIFLRGLGREAAHWGPFLDSWRVHLPDTEIVTADLPGCGVHHRQRSPWSVPDMVGFVRGALGYEGAAAGETGGSLSQPATDKRRPTGIFAMSLGAMVAYDWLRAYPGEVEGLVLVNGSIGGLSPPWHRLSRFGIWSLARAMTTLQPAAREARILALVSGQVHPLTGLPSTWAEIASLRPVSRLNALRQLVAAARFRPAFPPLVRHSLVLASAGDRMVNPACSRKLAAGIGAQVREHPTAGHDLPLDAPDWVAAEVAAWLGHLDEA